MIGLRVEIRFIRAMIKHNRCSHSSFLQSDFSSPPHRLCRQFPFSSKLCVRMGQSLLRGAHILPSSLFFIDHNLGVESHVRYFQALFCTYATVINEAPRDFISPELHEPPAATQLRDISPRILCSLCAQIDNILDNHIRISSGLLLPQLFFGHVHFQL